MLAKIQRKKAEAGFTILQVLVASLIGAIALLGTKALLKSFGEGTAQIQRQAVRNGIVDSIRKSLKDVQAIQRTFTVASADVNDPFYQCLSTTETAADCVNGVSEEFSLVDPTGRVLAGPVASPARFDALGGSCDETSIHCFLEATVRFEPACPEAAANCQRALNLRFFYLVQIAPALAANDEIPPFSPKSGEEVFSVRDLDEAVAQSCASNQTNTGVDTFGNLICAANTASSCGAGQISTGLDDQGRVICSNEPATSCPANQYVSGINADRSVQCTAFPQSQLVASNCPSGQVMVGINADRTARCDSPPPFQATVTVSSNTGLPYSCLPPFGNPANYVRAFLAKQGENFRANCLSGSGATVTLVPGTTYILTVLSDRAHLAQGAVTATISASQQIEVGKTSITTATDWKDIFNLACPWALCDPFANYATLPQAVSAGGSFIFSGQSDPFGGNGVSRRFTVPGY